MISSSTARPRPCAVPPWIWPSSASRLRVRPLDSHVLDAEFGARDLALDRDQALPDFSGRGVDTGDRLAAFDGEQDARGREIVEALRVTDVLDPDAVADAPAYALAVRGVAVAAGQQRVRTARWWHRHGAQLVEHLGQRRRRVDHLAGRDGRALF